MATTKQRINISVSKGVRDVLTRIAKRDQKPVASKAADLLELALEIEEDRALDAIATERLKTTKKMLSHKEVWK